MWKAKPIIKELVLISMFEYYLKCNDIRTTSSIYMRNFQDQIEIDKTGDCRRRHGGRLDWVCLYGVCWRVDIFVNVGQGNRLKNIQTW